MSDFPATKKTFSQLVDGTTFMEGTNVNQTYDEVEAVQTMIGAIGRSQSYSASLKALLTSYKRGCLCEYKGAADFYVRAGEVSITDASGNIAYRKNTSDLTCDWTNIDIGGEGNNTYYVYAVADSAATTFTVVISLNATTPTGCTYYKRLGSFINATDITNGSFTNDGVAATGAGTAVAKSAGTNYQAATDGFVQGNTYTAGQGNGFYAYTDTSATPSTVVQRGHTLGGLGEAWTSVPIAFYVKKGNYYRVEGHDYTYSRSDGQVENLQFVPIGA